MKRNQTTLILCIDIGSHLQQKFGHFKVIVSSWRQNQYTNEIIVWHTGYLHTISYVPARCSNVEFLPCESRQLIFSGVTNRCTRTRFPFLAASSNAAFPRSKSATSSSPSRIRSNGVAPSRFFFDGSAPCFSNSLTISYFPLAAAVNHIYQ